MGHTLRSRCDMFVVVMAASRSSWVGVLAAACPALSLKSHAGPRELCPCFLV